MKGRASGVLLHVTSLPSPFGIGDLGPWAFRFADMLSEFKQSYWEILPLTPTSLGYGNSPYSTSSAFAGNPLLISPELLYKEGLLMSRPCGEASYTPSARVDYKVVSEFKGVLTKKAYHIFKKKYRDYSSEFETFCDENSHWLEEFALYSALREEIGKPWDLWPAALKNKESGLLVQKRKSLVENVEFEKFVQFIFFKQWHSLKDYCNKKRINIIGDLPFYVNHDSADVWSYQDMFKLDSEKRSSLVGGVPPDYFSSTGQLWGNPVYDWDRLAEARFKWWMDRIAYNLKLFDILRLDHFRGFVAYWEVPVGEKTAVNGRWVKTPSEDFFKTLITRFPHLPFIAEDLGVITDDVRDLINRLDMAGMRVLVFAFSNSPENPHLPDNYPRNSVVFTGTHDTNTSRGWFVEEATPNERANLFRYVGKQLSEEVVSWELIRLAMVSVADLGILPLQDILSLGSEARMNFPSKTEGNWEWRADEKQLASDAFRKLGEMTELSGRC